MDTEIQEIRRLAGILTEREAQTFDVATHERLMELVSDDIKFIERLAVVLGQILPQDRASQMMRVLQDRRQTLQRLQRDQAQLGRKHDAEKQQQAAGAYADTDAAETNQVGGRINTSA